MNSAEVQRQLGQMISGYWQAQSIYAAAKLELSDLLADGPMTVEQLASASGAHAPSLYRLLRALASDGVYAQRPDGKFELTPLAEPLRRNVPGSQWAMAVMMGEEHYHVWGDLIFSLETGETAFNRIYGMPIFEFLSENEEKGQIFDQAMTSIHGPETAAIINAYDFAGIKTLADIGGGNGSTLIPILKAHPQLRGVLFDLPPVIERTREHVAVAGLADRCELVAGSFFESVPAGADAYLLRHIIHDWNDEQCHTILSNCHAAMRASDRLLVVESVIPPGNEPYFGKWLDLTMMLIPGGKERTEVEYRELYTRAGFDLTTVTPTAVEVSVIEGRKK